jgi:hypothetical protein
MGTNFFEFNYDDLDLMDWFMDFEEDSINESWRELEEIYNIYSDESEEFDVYEQDEEEEAW